MALLFIDGFDHMVGSTGLSSKWGTVGGTVSTASARSGAVGLNVTSTQISKALPASGGFVFGVAVKVIGTVLWGSYDLLQARESTTVHLTLSTNGSNQLCVKRGSTVLATGTTFLAQNNWYYIEFKGVIDSVAGSYAVQIDGVAEPNLSATAVNTRNGGTTGQWDRLALNGSNHNFDDLYVCDLSGSANNDFLGSCKVETRMALADFVLPGSNHGLTPSTGTDHGALVDETTPNASDYNYSDTVGTKDTYKLPALAFTPSGAVYGIQTNLFVAKSDSGTRTVCAVVRSGGTDYDGTGFVPSTSFGFRSEIRQVNPATGLPWTVADLNALEVGMKIVS